MPQIYDMGPTALLPLRRKACWGFFSHTSNTCCEMSARALYEFGNGSNSLITLEPLVLVSEMWSVFMCINVWDYRNEWTGYLSRYSDWLRPGRSGDRIPVGGRFSALVQTGPGAHPTFCTMGTGSFPGVKRGRVVTLTPHPLLVPWSRKSRAKPLLPVCAVRPVQRLSACTRVHFTVWS